LIGLLLCTAAILTTMLAMTWSGTSQSAQASPAVQAGDYIVTPAKIRDGKEVLYVIDARNQKMIVYYINEKTNSIDTLTGMALREIKAFRN
ncbi:MAG: hypothetical protein ACOCZE_06455, partial [Planctomycetota bacterium]